MNKLKFSINIAAGTKKIKTTNTFTKVSKLIEAVVVLDGDILKARLTTSPVENSISEFRVFPFTPKSFELRDRKYIFHKNKDKYGHNQVYIRDEINAHIFPGLTSQYNSLVENLLINGYIVKNNDKFYFDYKELVAFREYHERLIKTKKKNNDK